MNYSPAVVLAGRKRWSLEGLLASLHWLRFRARMLALHNVAFKCRSLDIAAGRPFLASGSDWGRRRNWPAPIPWQPRFANQAVESRHDGHRQHPTMISRSPETSQSRWRSIARSNLGPVSFFGVTLVAERSPPPATLLNAGRRRSRAIEGPGYWVGAMDSRR